MQPLKTSKLSFFNPGCLQRSKTIMRLLACMVILMSSLDAAHDDTRTKMATCLWKISLLIGRFVIGIISLASCVVTYNKQKRAWVMVDKRGISSASWETPIFYIDENEWTLTNLLLLSWLIFRFLFSTTAVELLLPLFCFMWESFVCCWERPPDCAAPPGGREVFHC